MTEETKTITIPLEWTFTREELEGIVEAALTLPLDNSSLSGGWIKEIEGPGDGPRRHDHGNLVSHAAWLLGPSGGTVLSKFDGARDVWRRRALTGRHRRLEGGDRSHRRTARANSLPAPAARGPASVRRWTRRGRPRQASGFSFLSAAKQISDQDGFTFAA